MAHSGKSSSLRKRRGSLSSSHTKIGDESPQIPSTAIPFLPHYYSEAVPKRILFWITQIHLFIHSLWLRLLRALSLPFFYPKEQFYHHILITGDDHAFGIGDYCTPGHKVGIANRLVHDLLKHQTLRHTWRTINLGQPSTTSRDWLPSTALFKQAYLRGSADQRHGDVVVLLLGMKDLVMGMDGMETVNNIKMIAEVLASEFAYVFIPTLPNWLVSLDMPAVLEQSNICNAALRSWNLEQLPISNICVGPEVDRTNSEYRRGTLYYYDHQHFSTTGYNKLSEDLASIMVKCMRKVEFTEEKKYIH